MKMYIQSFVCGPLRFTSSKKTLFHDLKNARGVIGTVKNAAKRSRFIVGREGWKLLVVNKFMYSVGTITCYEKECDELERMQREMGRWLWGCRLYLKY